MSQRFLHVLGMAMAVLLCATASQAPAQQQAAPGAETDYGPRIYGPHQVKEWWGAYESDAADTEVRYFVARPDDEKAYPGVYFIYGRPGLDDRLFQEIRRLASYGFVVFTSHYREALLIPAFTPLVDPDTALKLVEDGFDEFLKLPNMTPEKPCVISTVRGGMYMVKMAAKDKFACMIGYHPVLIDHAWPEQFQEITLLQEFRKVRTPTMLLIGSADFEVRQNQSKRAAFYLESKNVPVDLVIYSGGARGFDFRIIGRTLADDLAKTDSMYRTVAFIHKHMGHENPGGPLLGATAAAPVPGVPNPFPGVARFQPKLIAKEDMRD